MTIINIDMHVYPVFLRIFKTNPYLWSYLTTGAIPFCEIAGYQYPEIKE